MLESKIRKLIKILEETESISEIEVTGWGSKIRVSKKASGNNNHNNSHSSSAEEALPLRTITISAPPVAEAPPPVPAPTPAPDKKLVGIRSPMVGTFYRATAPTAKPYIEEGQEVKVGQAVCIIEAMKLMNEIESDVAGRVIKICVENTKAVEFGQDLFLVEPFST